MQQVNFYPRPPRGGRLGRAERTNHARAISIHALREEGVDRNRLHLPPLEPPRVALLAEGVDRNTDDTVEDCFFCHVALLAEGVDRNVYYHSGNCTAIASPSSRRAWIEIPDGVDITGKLTVVALLAEGVDRNNKATVILASPAGRPPRGGRG